jgi:thiosulfate dehydrogenase
MKRAFPLRLAILIITIAVVVIADRVLTKEFRAKKLSSPASIENFWVAPDTNSIPKNAEGELIRYGRLLIANTAFYLGPKGVVSHTTNGMNCQNCHLSAGTKPNGNNYGGVFSTYPKFRERRGAVENIFQRINDCLERSLNGKALDTSSHEMQAILAYIKWLGKEVPKGQKPKGAGIHQPAFMDRAADAQKGKLVYEKKCVTCHSQNGQGKMNADSITYLYPPLWGEHSYNVGAGLYRLSRFAGYVKDNMPFGATNANAQLTDVEAWDVAAFVNSQPRPKKDLSKDWPDISLKPFDHPFAPYTDSFSESQHKYGPFAVIQKAKDNSTRKKSS